MMISKNRLMRLMIAGSCLGTTAEAQNIGIGIANPQKGRLEIAGALGGHTTVLTIGSDGAGISLQRNWPTIGLNQYRDASNKQRFIGAGYAGSIFLSQDDGSIVFTQFGQGSANQEILTATYPLSIDPLGNTVINGSTLHKQQVTMNQDVTLNKDLYFTQTPRVASYALGLQSNLLPIATGYIRENGTKARGTNNYTSGFVANIGYVLTFPESLGSDLILTITPRGQEPCSVSYSYNGFGLYFVYFWNKDGQKVTREFTFTAFR